MNCELSLRLKGISPHYRYDTLSNILEANLKMYYDWALLNIGGWQNVDVPTSGLYFSDFSTLRPVSDPNYTDGQVWEAFRKDWVWESGFTYTDYTGGTHEPQRNTQVLVDSSPNTGYYVNYPLGQIVFTTPVSTGSTVQADYSFREVQIYRIQDAGWWKELQYASYRGVDSSLFNQIASGDWSIFSQNRVQLPAIVIETVPRGGSQPVMLGSDSQYATRDIVFHIIAEDPWTQRQLMDIVNLQVDRKMWLFDNNLIYNSDSYPLDYKGSIVNNNNYTGFVSSTGYRYNTVKMKESYLQVIQSPHPRLHIADVKTTFEVQV